MLYLCSVKPIFMKLLIQYLFIFLFCFFQNIAAEAQNTIRLQGVVLDASNERRMPFVYIIVDENLAGGNTDLDGKFNFEVSELLKRITFTHVGYEDFVYEVNNPDDLKPLQRALRISLIPKNQQLPETVLTNANPAHSLIKKVLANRNLHNPKKLPFYSYNSYNKCFVDVDPLQTKKLPEPKDTAAYNAALFLEKHHLFLAETITSYQFLAPAFQYERVVANRVSGLQNPQFIALSTQGQLLNFYEDYFNLLNRQYLNPISEQAWKRYAFTLEDTTLIKPDTLFWIAFEPLPNKFFDGLKGRLAIHSRTFAIQSMDIESALPEKEVGLGFRLEQQNEWVNQQYWFPKQVRTELILRRVKIGGRRVIVQWQSYLADIDCKTKPKLRTFTDASLEISPDAHLQNKEFWASYRKEPLNEKELKTYVALDSIGAKEKFDKNLLLSQYLTFARVPINRWKMDLDLMQTLNFNRYEFIRIGAGFITNDLFSKRYTIGANLAYGTRDGNFKYGFLAQYRPFAHIDASFTARYTSDVQEPARVRFMEENTGIVIAPNRNFFISRVDKVRNFELKAQGRPLQNMRLGAFFRTQRILPTYDYYFTVPQANGENKTYTRQYQLTELNFQLQYFWGAQYIRMGNLRNLAAIQTPSFQLSYTQGMRALGSDFRYGKWDARLTHTQTFRHIGILHGELWVGFTKGHLPYRSLWNGQGTGKSVPSMIPSYFQTMQFYEFLNDRFVFLFLQHNFRKLLYKSPYKWLQPEPVLHHNFAWGNLRNPAAHQGVEVRTLQRGYWESGFMINNLLKFKYMGALKIGLGGGIFLRYGHYRNADFSQNVAYKFSFSVGI